MFNAKSCSGIMDQWDSTVVNAKAMEKKKHPISKMLCPCVRVSVCRGSGWLETKNVQIDMEVFLTLVMPG